MATATVTNSGKQESEEVVQLYITVPQTGDNPIYSLKGFQRIRLKPGEAKNIQFNLTPDILKSIDDHGQLVLPAGDYHVYIGGSQPSKRSGELGMSKPADIVLKVK